MKGQIPEILQAVAAVGISIILLVLLFPRIGGPAWETYGKGQADTIAQSVAMSINALATIDAGEIEKRFDGIWDVEIFVKDNQNWIKVKHEDISSDSVKILTNIKDVSSDNAIKLRGIRSILISKAMDQDVEVKAL